MKYNAVLFDLDGTLINTDLYVVCNYTHLFKKYDISRLPSLKEMVYFSGPPLVEIFAKYLPDIDVNLLKKDFLDYSLAHSNELSLLYENEKEVLSRLKENGIKLGLVTNKGKDAMEDCLKYFGLDKYFDSIFYLEKCEKCKPDPWPILACIDELGQQKEHCLYVGDDKYDIIAANKANVDSCLVKFGLKQGLEEYNPKYVVTSYLELERIIYGRK